VGKVLEEQEQYEKRRAQATGFGFEKSEPGVPGAAIPGCPSRLLKGYTKHGRDFLTAPRTNPR